MLNAELCERFTYADPDDGNGIRGTITRSYFTLDYSIDCDSDRHRDMTAPSYQVSMLLIYPLGVPLLYVLAYWSDIRLIRAQREKERNAARGSTADRTSDEDTAGAPTKNWVMPVGLPPPNFIRRSVSILKKTVTRQRERSKAAFSRRKGRGRGGGTGDDVSLPASKPMPPPPPRKLKPHVYSLVRPYKREYYWFELFECARKMALTGVPAVISGDAAALRGTVGLLIAAGFFWGTVHLRPYARASDAVLAHMCQAVIFLLMVSRVMLQNEDR